MNSTKERLSLAVRTRLSKLLLAVFLFMPSQSFAWGHKGHAVVAYLAESHLTSAARAGIGELLATEGHSSMAEVASWADAVRKLSIPKQPPHSIPIPLNNEGIDLSSVCAGKECIFKTISEDEEVLKDDKMPPEARLMALKYIIHLVGDLHQPLHASEDTGQEKVIFKRKEVTIHKVWDTLILRCDKRSADDIAKSLPQSSQTLSLDPVVWARESRDIARDEIFGKIPLQGSSEIATLDKSYCDAELPTVYSRLDLAGLRLARVLNSLFPN